MAITTSATKKVVQKRAFALLIAVIFMAVMLSFGLTLASLAFKQQTLASSALQSQYAFYAADSALECALLADQKQMLFMYDSDVSKSAPIMSCNGVSAQGAAGQPTPQTIQHTASMWVTQSRLSLNGGKFCADVTVYKPNLALGTATTSLFAQGYNEPCDRIAADDSHLSSRGLEAYYH